MSEPEDDPPDPIIVEIDALLMRRMPSFLSNRRADVLALIEYARAGAFDGAAMLGHRLKGSGPSFGFRQLGTIGVRIEQAALVRDPEAICRCAAELAAFLDAVKVVPRAAS
jgi:HPt (histidine-containing phosphotransfer) domain-containing protein